MAAPARDIHRTTYIAATSEGEEAVSVHAKNTYQLLPSGECVRAEKQRPFLMGPETVGLAEGVVMGESDLCHFKTATDLIVMAAACAPRGATRMTVAIEVAGSKWECAVFGDRRAIYRGVGSIDFSEPERFETIPLRYEAAYGGVDTTQPEPEIQTLEDFFTKEHPGWYWRNPKGRGYVVHENAERIDGLLLPNLEHPLQLLSPANLVAGDPGNWWRQPMPWSCDWFDGNWYPRCRFAGLLPDGVPEDDRQMPEVMWGWIEANQQRLFREIPFEDRLDPRIGNAASPALVLPFLRGNESIRLRGMTMDGEIVVRLPGDVPRMEIAVGGQRHSVIPVLNRVLISTEEMGVYTVWSGLWPFGHLPSERALEPGDPDPMKMGRFEVFVDGERVAPLE